MANKEGNWTNRNKGTGSGQGTGSNLILVYGPSASGKTTIVNEVVNSGLAIKVVTNTTREPREGEIDGIHYNFVTEDEFLQLDKLEYTNYGGSFYGLAKSEVDIYVNEKIGVTAIIILDIAGIKNVRNIYPEATTVYIDANEDTVISRMKKRGDSAADIKKRLLENNQIVKYVPDFVIINEGDLEQSVEKFGEIIFSLKNSRNSGHQNLLIKSLK